MRRWVVLALRTVLVIAVAGALAVQVAVLTLPWVAEDPWPTGLRLALAVIVALGIGCLQLIAWCVWKLVTRVRRGTVFSPDSFRYVDIVIGAIATGAVLILGVAVVARFANHAVPGDEIAPGVVGVICGLALVAGGVALVVYVLRVLLRQAVNLDRSARELRAELDEVI